MLLCLFAETSSSAPNHSSLPLRCEVTGRRFMFPGPTQPDQHPGHTPQLWQGCVAWRRVRFVARLCLCAWSCLYSVLSAWFGKQPKIVLSFALNCLFPWRPRACCRCWRVGTGWPGRGWCSMNANFSRSNRPREEGKARPKGEKNPNGNLLLSVTERIFVLVIDILQKTFFTWGLFQATTTNTSNKVGWPKITAKRNRTATLPKYAKCNQLPSPKAPPQAREIACPGSGRAQRARAQTRPPQLSSKAYLTDLARLVCCRQTRKSTQHQVIPKSPPKSTPPNAFTCIRPTGWRKCPSLIKRSLKKGIPHPNHHPSTHWREANYPGGQPSWGSLQMMKMKVLL